MSALAEFDRLLADVEQAKERLQDARSHQHDARRLLEQRRAELRQHVVAAHAGDVDHDPGRLAELQERAQQAAGTLVTRVVEFGKGVTEAEDVDLVAEARVEGCLMAVERAENELRAYASGNYGALCAELAANDCRRSGALTVAALDARDKALHLHNQVYAKVATVHRWAGRESALQSVAPPPFENTVRPPAVHLGPVPLDLVGE